jgi:MscS family membrane protein
MLEKIYYGNSLKEWGISLLIVIGALIINIVIRFLFRTIIRKITSKTKTNIDNIIIDSVEKPLLTGVVLLAIWIAAIRLNFSQEFHETLVKSYDILVVLIITWLLNRLFTSFIKSFVLRNSRDPEKSKHSLDPKLLPVTLRTITITVWLLGIITALHNVGVQVTTLMGTLGIGGIAFALAAQDTIKNIFGGFTIFTDRTFRIGDIIKFDSMEGTVVDIGLRSTRIQTYDRQIATVPNYKLTDALIVNISSEPGRRIVTELGLTYDTTSEKMQEAIDILKRIPEKVPEIYEQDLTAVFTKFGDSALTITFIYFIRPEAGINDTRSKVNFEILKEFSRAGLNFAFPSQTVYLC